MATILINGQEVTIPDGQRLNLIQAAALAGIEIPHYCYHPGLSVVASCRMCLVEVGQRDADGNIRMMPKLVPACATPATDGTVVVTNSEKVRHAESLVEECLLLDHPVDCPICDQAGECYLQDYFYKYGQRERRAPETPFTSRRKDLGPYVTLFVNRCIMCSRCVRFTREVSGTGELAVVRRGNKAIIDVFDDYQLDNPLSGNTVDICPVGALCSIPFLYKQRVWFLRGNRSICLRCSTGCAIQVDHNRNRVYRLKPRYNPNANDWWMCDFGRFGFDYVYAEDRLRQPMRRTDGMLQPVSWDDIAERFAELWREAAGQDGTGTIAVVLSPFLSCEDAYLSCLYFRNLALPVRFYLGRVPVHGADETFPRRLLGAITNGRQQEPRFVIRAERCPNRRGVEAIIRHFQGEVPGFDDFLRDARQQDIAAAYLTGGYPESWLTEQEADVMGMLRCLVVHDVLPGPHLRHASVVLPMAVWFERAGSYVNYNGTLQCTERAVLPAADARSVGRLMWALLGRTRLYRPEVVLEELAEEVPVFAPAAELKGEFPEYGVRLDLSEPAHEAV